MGPDEYINKFGEIQYTKLTYHRKTKDYLKDEYEFLKQGLMLCKSKTLHY